MTAEKYVKDVGKFLKCRASKRKKIKEQLLSEINSAVSKGEDLETVLGRMGIPWEYANRCNDHFDNAERKAAKRERRLMIWGIVLFVIGIVLVNVYLRMPRWSDISESTVFCKEQVRAQAEEIIRLYSDNDFQAVNAYMADDMKQVLNAATLQYTKSQMDEEFGELLAFENMEISEAKQKGEFYAMVQADVSYSNGSASYTMTFDEDMKLVGFMVK